MTDADGAEAGVVELDEYCRAIESHVCRRNDGHLIRVAGPTFDLVRGWAEQGVPLKVALAGIDRTFERYYRKGNRRRPLQVSFCDADVLDAFDEWRRALGLTGGTQGGTGAGASMPPPAATGGGHAMEIPAAGDGAQSSVPATAIGDDTRRPQRAGSLPAHLERVANRLTLLRGDPRNDAGMEAALADAVLQMDAHRTAARGARGAAREALVARLEALDDSLLSRARAGMSAQELEELARDAAASLEPYRERMPRAAYDAACDAALTRLVRERAGLPVIRYDAGTDPR